MRLERRYGSGVFRHEGPSRSATSNGILAGYLALIAGFVNSGGFVLLRTFTSHVTGSIGRLANDVAATDWAAATLAAIFVVAFFGGAFVASLLIESQRRRVARAYGLALLLEALALVVFAVIASAARFEHARALDAQAAILCFAMGMQNSLVTNLSGAVVRTTHLTGVVTDLGIEASRWYFWFVSRRSAVGSERPATAKSALLVTILITFTAGAFSGALLTAHVGPLAMLVPIVALLMAAGYALVGGSSERDR